MTSAHSIKGKSLSERIRSYPPDVPNDEIAADIPADYRLVSVVRAKQKRAAHYRKKQTDHQRQQRRDRAKVREIAWALAWVETFPAWSMPDRMIGRRFSDTKTRRTDERKAGLR